MTILSRSLKQQRIEAEGAGQRITRSPQIARALREWQDRPHELSVSIGREVYASRITQVDPPRLLIDTLLPKSGDVWVEKRPVARFQCLVFEEGVERICTFEGMLQEILPYKGFPSIQVAFPDELYERVQRYYVQPDQDEVLWVRFDLYGQQVEQRVTEVSLYDVRFRAKLNVRGEKLIPEMSIRLPDEMEVIGKAILKRLSLYDYTLEYTEVTPEGQQLLSWYIFKHYRGERGIARVVLPPIRSSGGSRRVQRVRQERSIKILMLERDPEVIQRVQQFLGARTWTCLVEKEYNERILDIVTRERPHLILMGIGMANPDDLALMEVLQETPFPVVALVDPSDGEQGLEAFSWGILDYALKPLDMEELVHKIEVILHLEGFYPDWGEPLRRALVFGGQDGMSYDIKAWATQWDYALEWVKEEIEGVRRAQKIRPDVILIDEEGLSMDSRSICRALSIQATASSIPVVVIGRKGQRSDLEDLSNVVYVQRPVDPLYLMEMVGWISSRMQDHPLTIFGLSVFIEGEGDKTGGE